MTPLFEDERVWKRLLKVIDSWMGTPYRHLVMVKGRGADCSLFIAAILLEASIIKKIEHDYYPRDWHIHTKQELVRDGFTTHLSDHLADGLSSKLHESDDIELLLRGDILGFSTQDNGITNHASIYLGEEMVVHSINYKGVCNAQLDNWWKKRLTSLFRIYK